MAELLRTERLLDVATMRTMLRKWIAAQRDMAPGMGRWAMTLRGDGVLIGGITLLPMPVPEADVELAYHLMPEQWGRGYATEAARALARWAFQCSLVEVFALVAPANARAAATARRIGMEWVGESDKYHGAHLEVYRLRPDDLAHADHPLQLIW
jgi:[ribosomal protein S5]-alanine N-acetyltransferase